MTSSLVATCAIAAAATLGVIARPFRWPEAVWSVAGATVLVGCGLLDWTRALKGARKGADVYFFLVGMMLLAETAREAGLFTYLAAHATRCARGSATALFLLVYGVGTLVTIFLSNDATAVVLTPAVAAAVKTAKSGKPLPYLYICAFVANAASFVLPISNPANLVLYRAHVPSLLEWLPRFALPSAFSIGSTYVLLRFTQRRALEQHLEKDVPVPTLRAAGVAAAIGIGATAVVLMGASALDLDLGIPTAAAGLVTAVTLLVRERTPPWKLISSVSWSVVPLVAGLFVLVEGLENAGVVGAMGVLLRESCARSERATAWIAGLVVAFAGNAMNNLPAGLIAGSAVKSAHAPEAVTRAILIGVDLGPNLSVTGSLATVLWLNALRREGLEVGAWTFLRVGIIVMIPALVLSLFASALFP